MKKLMITSVLFSSLIILGACQTNPDGSIGGYTEKTEETNTNTASGKLDVTDLVRVQHDGWATIEGTTEPNKKVTASIGEDADENNVTTSDGEGNFAVKYEMSKRDDSQRLMIHVYDGDELIASKEIELVRK